MKRYLLFLAALLTWTALGQVTTVNLSFKSTNEMAAFTVTAYQTNLNATVTSDDVKTGFSHWQFAPGDTTTAGTNAVVSTGVAGRWLKRSLVDNELDYTFWSTNGIRFHAGAGVGYAAKSFLRNRATAADAAPQLVDMTGTPYSPATLGEGDLLTPTNLASHATTILTRLGLDGLGTNSWQLMPAMNTYKDVIKRITSRQYESITYVGPTATTALTNAIAAITDASAYKRYMVYVTNGTYDPILMKDWVDVIGQSTNVLITTSGNVDTVHGNGKTWMLANVTVQNTHVGGAVYPFHSDGSPNTTNQVDQILYNVHADGGGVRKYGLAGGLYGGMNLYLINCSARNTTSSPIYWHNHGSFDSVTQYAPVSVTLIGCISSPTQLDVDGYGAFLWKNYGSGKPDRLSIFASDLQGYGTNNDIYISNASGVTSPKEVVYIAPDVTGTPVWDAPNQELPAFSWAGFVYPVMPRPFADEALRSLVLARSAVGVADIFTVANTRGTADGDGARINFAVRGGTGRTAGIRSLYDASSTAVRMLAEVYAGGMGFVDGWEINGDAGYIALDPAAKGWPVVIGGASSNAIATLDLQATNRVFFPPRLTTAARDALTAQEGALIYNLTTHLLEIYNGTHWTNAW